MAKIRSIRRKRRSDRVTVHFEDAEKLELPTEIAIRWHLRKGRELSSAELAEMDAEATGWRCKEAALLLLSYRPRTEWEMHRRLRQKEFAEAVVEDCVADLRRSGLLDDAEFAHLTARDKLRTRPVGQRRLESDLRAKGVAPKLAQQAAERAVEESPQTEVELAREAARKFRLKPGEDTQATRRRLYGFLGRRGFSSEAIRQVMDEMVSGGD